MSKQSGNPLKFILIVAVLCGGGWAGYHFWFKGGDTKPKYQVSAVKRTDIVHAVTATGQLSALITVDVGTQISGNIKTLSADFNTPVKAGQVVAILDPATFQAVVHQAEGELANVQSALELARLDARRIEELAKSKIAPANELDKALAQLKQAEAAVKIREGSLAKARIDLARCTITSPVDGIVISRNVDEGQTVAASMTAPVLFTIANDLTKMHIEANVSEADIGGVREGLEATFTVDAFPDRIFRGKVAQVRYAPITVDNVVTYVTVVDVNNPDMELRPGMTANVSIVLDERRDALGVQNAALRFRPPAKDGEKTASSRPPEGGGAGGPGGSGGGGKRSSRRSEGGGGEAKSKNVARKLYVLDGESPKAVDVVVGITDGGTTEIVSGLEEGAPVITGIMAPSTGGPAPASSSPFGPPSGGRTSRRSGL